MFLKYTLSGLGSFYTEGIKGRDCSKPQKGRAVTGTQIRICRGEQQILSCEEVEGRGFLGSMAYLLQKWRQESQVQYGYNTVGG